MTCRHVLDVIDAAPFVDDPDARLDGARSHAGRCQTCGPALATSEVLTDGLRGLAQLAAPVHIKATVMARIAHADLTTHEQEAGASRIRTMRREWSGWAPLAGLLACLSMVLPTYLTAGDPLRIWNTGGLAIVSAAPQTTLATLVMMMCGLALFVGSLLVPLARRRR